MPITRATERGSGCNSVKKKIYVRTQTRTKVELQTGKQLDILQRWETECMLLLISVNTGNHPIKKKTNKNSAVQIILLIAFKNTIPFVYLIKADDGAGGWGCSPNPGLWSSGQRLEKTWSCKVGINLQAALLRGCKVQIKLASKSRVWSKSVEVH